MTIRAATQALHAPRFAQPPSTHNGSASPGSTGPTWQEVSSVDGVGRGRGIGTHGREVEDVHAATFRRSQPQHDCMPYCSLLGQHMRLAHHVGTAFPMIRTLLQKWPHSPGEQGGGGAQAWHGCMCCMGCRQGQTGVAPFASMAWVASRAGVKQVTQQGASRQLQRSQGQGGCAWAPCMGPRGTAGHCRVVTQSWQAAQHARKRLGCNGGMQ